MNKSNILLGRDSFREGTFERDGHRCVMCGRGREDGVLLDSHHIMERALWVASHEFGGYFRDNGVTLCDTGFEKTPVPQKDGSTKVDWSCHLRAGMTLLSPAEVRKAAGIETVHLPEQLYEDADYTVWGDTILKNGQRTKGECFDDESVQKVLKMANVLHFYTDHYRHPRTYHLPFSPIIIAGNVGDDKVMKSTKALEGEEIVATVKWDGAQCSVYNDYMHGRSPDFKSDPTWHWMQNFVSSFQHEIPKGWRLNIENLKGSAGTDIQYFNLRQFACAFMMWDNTNHCLSWDETVEWVTLFDDMIKATNPKGLPLTPVLYRGPYSREAIEESFKPSYNGDPLEGLVVRATKRFHYRDASKYIGKWVRKEHKVRHGGEVRWNELKDVPT